MGASSPLNRDSSTPPGRPRFDTSRTSRCTCFRRRAPRRLGVQLSCRLSSGWPQPVSAFDPGIGAPELATTPAHASGAAWRRWCCCRRQRSNTSGSTNRLARMNCSAFIDRRKATHDAYHRLRRRQVSRFSQRPRKNWYPPSEINQRQNRWASC
jgi:hypothetical protein